MAEGDFRGSVSPVERVGAIRLKKLGFFYACVTNIYLMAKEELRVSTIVVGININYSRLIYFLFS